MIISTTGNLIVAETEALVNTVNCEGFMGKGIALQFKQAFPDNYKAYKKVCDRGELRPGHMFIFDTGSMVFPKYIINFPTKDKWRAPSKMEYIKDGLAELISEIRRLEIKSVAVPPLGAGLGGLDWKKVKPLIEEAFAALPEVEVQLFEPKGAPKAKDMPIRTKRPELTVARSLFIALIHNYTMVAWHITLLEIQKLAYFLQTAGQPMKLKYVAHIYGPYADNLNKVLENLEGHYTQGYGDSRKHDVEIELLPKAYEQAAEVLTEDKDALDRLDRVQSLISGFETPYGLELLATVHWLAAEGRAMNEDQAVQGVWSWNDRKRRLFKEKHIRQVWGHLQNEGWINSAAEGKA